MLFQDLLNLLDELDQNLDEEITLYIIGGGAMCHHNFRDNTYDLDSFEQLNENIKNLIKKVYSSNWLNDEASRVPYKTLFLNNLRFKTYDMDLKKLKLKFAELDSLLKSKLLVLYNITSSGHSLSSYNCNKDIKDIKSILKALDINNKSSLNISFAVERKFPDIDTYVNPKDFDKYPKIDIIDKFKIFSVI